MLKSITSSVVVAVCGQSCLCSKSSATTLVFPVVRSEGLKNPTHSAVGSTGACPGCEVGSVSNGIHARLAMTFGLVPACCGSALKQHWGCLYCILLVQRYYSRGLLSSTHQTGCIRSRARDADRIAIQQLLWAACRNFWASASPPARRSTRSPNASSSSSTPQHQQAVAGLPAASVAAATTACVCTSVSVQGGPRCIR